MKETAMCLVVLGATLTASALESVSNEFWNTTAYVDASPNRQEAEFGTFDSQAFTCGWVAPEVFDALAFTLHMSNALRMFRSTPPCGLTMIYR